MARETPHQTKSVAQARDVLLQCAANAKRNIENTLEGGGRDWPKLRAYVEQYIDYQTAADLLGYGGTVEKP
jgi:hypothetical protein